MRPVGVSAKRPEARLKKPSNFRILISVAGLLLLAFAGYIKASPPMQRLVPIDLTLVGAALVMAIVFYTLLTQRFRLPAGTWAVLVLWASFFIGFPVGEWNVYTQSKILYLFTLSLPCAVGAVVLLRTSKARTWLLAGVVALGVLMAVLSIVSPNEQAAINGRLAVDGSNTIAAGRAAGAAVVVLLVLALGRSRQWRLAVLAAMGLSLSMIAAGSRGPLLAAIIAVIIVSTASRSARKVQRLALGLGALALAWWVASQLQLIPERLIAGIILVIVLVKALKRQWEAATTPVEMAMLGLFIFFLQSAMVSGDVNSNRGVWIALGAGLVAVQSAPTSPKKRSKRDANTRLLNQTPSARVCHLSPAVKHWVRGGLHAPNCRAWRAFTTTPRHILTSPDHPTLITEMQAKNARMSPLKEPIR